MSGVEEIRSGLSLTNQKAQEGIAALQQAALAIEEAQAALTGAITGTSQAEMQHSYGLLAEVAQTIGGAQGTLNRVITNNETYAGGL